MQARNIKHTAVAGDAPPSSRLFASSPGACSASRSGCGLSAQRSGSASRKERCRPPKVMLTVMRARAASGAVATHAGARATEAACGAAVAALNTAHSSAASVRFADGMTRAGQRAGRCARSTVSETLSASRQLGTYVCLTC
jgi:hypothetical protein